MKMKTLALLVFGILLTAALPIRSAHAFPDLVRHGYANCTSCHVSPTGGGVMTQYGRELSRELLSAWGRDGEGQFAYGTMKTPEWLQLGGDYRTAYVYRDTPTYRDGRSIFMQADLEMAAAYEKVTFAGTLGYQNPISAQTLQDHLVSHRHYLLGKVNDEVTVRGGKFLPAFGINDPNHVSVVRRAMRLNDEGMESYNLEGAYLGESSSLHGTLIVGRPDNRALKRDAGLSVVGSRTFYERYRAGLSYYYGNSDTQSRHVGGPFAVLGFTSKLYLLNEFDFLSSTPKLGVDRRTQWGLANFQKLGYELTQGLHFYLSRDFGRLNFRSERTQSQSYGAGIQFFPRPHFELNLTYQKQQNVAEFSDFVDYSYLMFHFYL